MGKGEAQYGLAVKLRRVQLGSGRCGSAWHGGYGALWFVMGGKFRNGTAGSVMARRFWVVG